MESTDTGGTSWDPGLSDSTDLPDPSTPPPDDGAQAFVDSQTGTTFQLDPSTGLPVALDPSAADLHPLTDSASIDPSLVASDAVNPLTGTADPFGALGSISGLDPASSPSDGASIQAAPAAVSDGGVDPPPTIDTAAAGASDATPVDAGGTPDGSDLAFGGSDEGSSPPPETQTPEPEPAPPPDPSD
jgi:hypothetical protein